MATTQVPREEWAEEARPEVSGGSIARNVSWAGLGHLASQGTWFASLIVLAAFVPPGSFGVVTAAMVIVNVGTLLIGSSTAGDLVASKTLSAERLRGSLLVTFGAGVVVCSAVALLAGPIVTLFGTGAEPGVLRGLIAGLALQATSIVPMALMRRHLRFRRVALATGGSAVVASVAAVAAAALGLGVWALVLRQVLLGGGLALMAWWGARDLFPPRAELLGRGLRLERSSWAGGGWYLAFAVVTLLAINVDFVVVGRLLDTGQLGLYGLAFTLGFAPLTQFSWQVGQVLFPSAAATPTLAEVAERTLSTLRLCALVLCPLVAPVVVLAPWLVPDLLGERWSGMVAPLQILFACGVAHGVANMIGESLTATGAIDYHAKMQAAWLAAMVPLLILLVQADGIRGAALAHLVVLPPLLVGYATGGARRIGLRPGQVGAALRDVALAVSAQAVATAAVFWGLESAGAGVAARGLLATLAGAAALLLVLTRVPSRPLAQGRRLVGAALGRS